MKPYTHVAESYDYLLRHVDYDQWYRYIWSLMVQYVHNPRLVVELGCGTGKFGAKFSADGYAIYGIDRSLEMLKVARLRAFGNFRVLCADMKNFTLARKADFIFSVHDTMNYFLDYDGVRSVLASVREIMHKGSVFMFDITTRYNIDRNFDGKTATYAFRGREIEWSNVFNPKKSLVTSTLKFSGPRGKKSVEKHVQRIYALDEMRNDR